MMSRCASGCGGSGDLDIQELVSDYVLTRKVMYRYGEAGVSVRGLGGAVDVPQRRHKV